MSSNTITWKKLENISPQLSSDLKRIIKEKKLDIDNQYIIQMINNSETIVYLINNYSSFDEAKEKIIEEFDLILKKELCKKIYSDNLDFINNYIKSHEKHFKNKKNKNKGFDVLEQLFNSIELEPDFDLLISMYDNIKLIQESINEIVEKNLESIKSGTFALLCNNGLVTSFIEIYCIKHDIAVALEPDKDLDSFNISNNSDNDLEVDIFQSDLVRQIISDSKKYPLLKQEETKELIEKAQNGSKYAEEKIIKHNQRLVINILKKYLNKNIGFLDLFQEGCIGLTKAIRKFDLTKGFYFSTYATWWIRQGITRAIADQARTIRIPVHMVEKLNKLKRTYANLTEKMGREPLIKELAKEMKCKESYILDLIKYNQDAISYNTKIDDEEDSELVDFISSDYSIEKDYDNSSFYENLIKFIDSLNLSERQKYTVLHRFDIPGFKKLTLEEIAKRYNITRERIRQEENKVKKIIFFSSKAKDFCSLMPNPEFAYKQILEYQKEFYNKKSTAQKTTQKTHSNLALRIGIEPATLVEMIKKLQEKDQLFIKEHYDEMFDSIDSAWIDDDDNRKISTIILRIKKAYKNPDYKPQTKRCQNLANFCEINKEHLNLLLTKLSIADQKFIDELYDENFDIKANIGNYSYLNRIVTDIKTLIKNPEYDPKSVSNLANILEVTPEELDNISSLLSMNIQRFLKKFYDENWNELKIKNKDEKKLLSKIIDLINNLKKTQTRGHIKQYKISSDITNLQPLELIMVMGLVSNDIYDVKPIAEFLNLDEEFVIMSIKEQLINCQKKYTDLILEKQPLTRKLKFKQDEEA